MNATKKRVFVVQQTMRWDERQEKLVEKFDLSPARSHGEIVYLLSPTAAPFNPDTVLPELHRKLKTIGPDDHLLLLGNPALIGIVCAIAADYTQGHLNLLQWSNRDGGQYIPIKIRGLFNDLGFGEK